MDNPLTNQSVVDAIIEAGVIKVGHFQYSSGWHGSIYFDKRVLYDQRHGQLLKTLLKPLVEYCQTNIDLVIVLAGGGLRLGQILQSLIIISQTQFNSRYIPVYHTSKNELGQHQLVTNTELLNGQRAIILDDVVTTGGSIIGLVMRLAEDDIRLASLTIGVLFNRACLWSAPTNPKIISLLTKDNFSQFDWQVSSPHNCQMCQMGQPISPKPMGES